MEQKGDLSIGPGLASAWQATSDTEWTFTLREDARWSVGRRITAEDVLFSQQRAPNLPVNLAAISIVARHPAEGATQSDCNSGKAAIAGVPYRLARFATNEIIELSRTAALLAGDVDLIDAPVEADLLRLRTDPRMRVAQTPGNRSIFFLPDIGRETSSPFVTDAQGNKLARNPLRDRRVREALSIAINRQTLTERILNGTAVPMGQFM